MMARGSFEEFLHEGYFVVTAEIGPPKNASTEAIVEKVNLLKGFCDAANLTDNQAAVVHMCSMASAVHVLQAGLEPIMQMTVRDRNRIALQSDLLGAYSLGIRNLVCMSGDHQYVGNHPESKGVFDLDSVQLVSAVRGMRDQFINGQSINGDAPDFFIGAVASPFLEPMDMSIARLEKKINAGANFIQTQCIYDMKKFELWMGRVRDLGLHERAFILPGLMPLKSPRVARYMQDNVPGVEIPEAIIGRLERVDEPAEQGVQLAVEQVQWLKNIEGVAGVHLMGVGWEEIIPRIVTEANLLPRPANTARIQGESG